MSEEQNVEKEVWKMPDPVFRSTTGRTPGTDPQADIPTEPGIAPEGPAGSAVQTVRPSSKKRIRHKRKAAPSNTMRTTIVVIIGSAIVLVVSLIYLLFFYRPIGR